MPEFDINNSVAEGDALIGESDAREMIRLLGNVAGKEVSLAGKRSFLMNGLARLVAADAWILITLGRRDAGELSTFSINMKSGFTEQQFADFLKANEHEDLKAIKQPLLEELAAKQSHISCLSQQADKEGLSPQSDGYALWKEADLATIMMSYWPTSSLQMSGALLFRRFERGLFSERDSRIAHIMLSEVPWLHSDNWPSRSDPDVHHLSPRLNTVLNLLLQGLGRKPIASQLGITINTVNGYAKDLYRRFDVHSQAELIRRFVEGDGGDMP